MGRWLLAAAACVWAEAKVVVAEPAAELPAVSFPLAGEAGGEVKIAALAGTGWVWRASLTAEGVRVEAGAEGMQLEILAKPVSGRLDAWSWRVSRGEIDLGAAWPALRGLAGEAAAGWSASGRLVLNGEGEWSAAAGPTGEVRLALREGWARSDELEVEVSGVELDVKTSDLTTGAMVAGQRLKVGKVAKAGAEVRDVTVEFGLTAGRVLEVGRLEAFFLGGRVKLRPFRVVLDKPNVEAAAEVDGVQLAELARLMPWAVEEAAGRLRGRVELAWDMERGLRIRDGGLEIVKVDGAEFRLARSPGMLTGDMPPKFGFFPAQWRWLRGLGFTNPAYKPLRDIELGEEGLRIETLRVSFWPDGPGVGRTVTIHVVGKPTGGKLVDEVVIDLNFHGPWTDFLAFGLNQEAEFGFRMK